MDLCPIRAFPRIKPCSFTKPPSWKSLLHTAHLYSTHNQSSASLHIISPVQASTAWQNRRPDNLTETMDNRTPSHNERDTQKLTLSDFQKSGIVEPAASFKCLLLPGFLYVSPCMQLLCMVTRISVQTGNRSCISSFCKLRTSHVPLLQVVCALLLTSWGD